MHLFLKSCHTCAHDDIPYMCCDKATSFRPIQATTGEIEWIASSVEHPDVLEIGNLAWIMKKLTIVYTSQVSGCSRFKSCPGWMDRWLAVGHSSAPLSSRYAFGKESETLNPKLPLNPQSNSCLDNRAAELVRKGLSFVRLVGSSSLSWNAHLTTNFATSEPASRPRSSLGISLFISI